MYRSLLVPLDRSPFAEQALPLALSITRRANARLDLVEVHGLYALDNNTEGAVVGEHRVTISIDPQKTKTALMPGARMPAQRGERVPGRYNRDSKLTCTVPPEGTKDARFDLKR